MLAPRGALTLTMAKAVLAPAKWPAIRTTGKGDIRRGAGAAGSASDGGAGDAAGNGPEDAVDTPVVEAGVAAGVALGVGVGVGVGDGDARAATTAVGGENAVAVPAALAPVTAKRSVRPTSSAASRNVVNDASATVAQAAPLMSQRSQA